jgi:hypothetical protein
MYSDVKLVNGIYIKFNSVDKSIGAKITGPDAGIEETADTGTELTKMVNGKPQAIATEATPMELELEDQQKLSGLGGLNEGYELDDEVVETVLFKPVDDKAIYDNGYFTSLENRIVDFTYLVNDIAKTGGMCKKLAMEAERIAPGFGGVPLGFYSEVPSATRYSASLEEITKNVICLLSEAIDKADEAEKKADAKAKSTAANNIDLQDNEQYRMQMAGISTAAFGYCKSIAKVHEKYVTTALKDVIKLYKKYDALFQIDPDKSMKVLEKKGLR